MPDCHLTNLTHVVVRTYLSVSELRCINNSIHVSCILAVSLALALHSGKVSAWLLSRLHMAHEDLNLNFLVCARRTWVLGSLFFLLLFFSDAGTKPGRLCFVRSSTAQNCETSLLSFSLVPSNLLAVVKIELLTAYLQAAVVLDRLNHLVINDGAQLLIRHSLPVVRSHAVTNIEFPTT